MMGRWTPWLALVAVGVAAFGVEAARQQEFPHDEHAGLFPLCAGCHEGIPTGDRGRFYPEAALCAGCHDGVELGRVDWAGPEREETNVVFSHPEHDEETVEEGLAVDCGTCHVPRGAPRMAVAGTVEGQCFDCHAHEADSHYVDADCATCHRPLAETRFALARIEALPEPATHDVPGFLEGVHGELAEADPARCSVCHTRELCTSCHVDAERRPVIAALPAAPAGMSLPATEARYFEPASHERPEFLEAHGALIAGTAGAACAACHTAESCTTCHTQPPPAEVRRLPARERVAAPGVVTARRAPDSHDAAFFAREHGAIAASDGAYCAACHTRSYCEDCHNAAATGAVAAAAPSSPPPARPAAPGGFHPADFLARHASTAYGRTLECSNCHDTGAFCRDCHEQSGFGAVGRLTQGFHDAEPLWLLRHPQAARQGLESCAACHQQRDCLQCHSQLGAFRISPHGPGFDARQAQKRNAVICYACHLDDPVNRRTP